EIASEPSQFLNELPLELIEDISSGSSWLSYARKGDELRAAAAALRGGVEAPPPKPKTVYTGKTYNTSDAVAEFFKNRGSSSEPQRRGDAENTQRERPDEGTKPLSAYERLKAAGTPRSKGSSASSQSASSGSGI